MAGDGAPHPPSCYPHRPSWLARVEDRGHPRFRSGGFFVTTLASWTCGLNQTRVFSS